MKFLHSSASILRVGILSVSVTLYGGGAALAAAATDVICTGCVSTTDIKDHTIGPTDLSPGSQPTGLDYTDTYAGTTLFDPIPTTPAIGKSVSLTLPGPGYVTVMFSAYARINAPVTYASCYLVKSISEIGFGARNTRLSGHAVNDRFPISVNRVFRETAAGTFTYSVACASSGAGQVSVFDGELIGIFVPRKY